ncbi:MAG: hypothetical protein LWX07_11990 [Bacteroidetes bacterium]|nr:hypothetical protein [Bacteroidota bacterium]
MKNIAKVVFNPEPEKEYLWNLSKNTVYKINNIWNKLDCNTLEIPEYDYFGYKGIKIDCESGHEFTVIHNHVIKKEDFITSVKVDSSGEIENILLRNMPDDIIDYVKPYVYATIAYKKAK